MSRNIHRNQVNSYSYAGGGEQCLSTVGRTPATASAAAWQEGRTFQVQLVLGIFWSFLLVNMRVRYYVIGSKHIKSVCQPALLLVQSTSPNILTSLLAGAEALYQRQGAAAAQARQLFKILKKQKCGRNLAYWKKLLMQTKLGEY